jgi:mannose/fructose/N-acetylgalactosamine-specific phosphotransferase system component IIB
MGYLGNHLATVVIGVFAAILTGLWPYFISFAPILNFVFIMAVSITWFLTFTCWISQKSTDYMHKSETHTNHIEKKSLSNTQTAQIYTLDERQVGLAEIKIAQNELSKELNKLKETVKLKDSEIDRLNQEISNLQTIVQIESLKAELANLKMLASGNKNRNK